ncbi:MAG: alpha/beta hydrolase [Burkholderiales bacterium]|nr:alpha/beta hydrolase [Burkholderiales bacterium]
MQHSVRRLIDGPAGKLELAIERPQDAPAGIALIAHPHPLQGGTFDNKVVTTLTRAFTRLGYLALRMNFRGVGQSEGLHDNGIGETEDMLAAADSARREFGNLPMVLAGFSFGAYVQSRVAPRIEHRRLVLIAPAVDRFEVGAVPGNTLVIHGDEDDVVPLSATLKWAKAQKLPVVVLPGAGHFFHGYLIELQAVVLGAFGAAANPA